MKIRSRFVSNSSSSSFIIVLPNKNHAKYSSEELLNYFGYDSKDILKAYDWSKGLEAKKAVFFLLGMLDNKNILRKRDLLKWFRDAIYYDFQYGWAIEPVCNTELKSKYIETVGLQNEEEQKLIDDPKDNRNEYWELWKKHQKDRQPLETRIAKDWVKYWLEENNIKSLLGKYNDPKVLYMITHEDHGEFSELETGSLYRNILHLKQSNH